MGPTFLAQKFSHIILKICKRLGSFSWFWAFFAKQIDKTHKFNIIWGWYEKIFEPKILVPWDIPGVTGTPISGGRTPRIFPTSVSGHMGSIQLPWHSGMLGTSRKSETDLQLGVIDKPRFSFLFVQCYNTLHLKPFHFTFIHKNSWNLEERWSVIFYRLHTHCDLVIRHGRCRGDTLSH